MVMKSPPHPGEVIREFVQGAWLNRYGCGEGTGVSRKALSELLNGHSGISPEMAVRLSKGFGGSAEALTQQMQYDLAQVEKEPAQSCRSLSRPRETVFLAISLADLCGAAPENENLRAGVDKVSS